MGGIQPLRPMQILVARLRRLRPTTILVYGLSLLIPFFLDKGPEIFSESCPATAGALPSFLFQKAVRAGSRKPTNNYVAVVTISKKEPTDVRTNPCALRKFEAKLLRTLERAEPAVIVLDLYFSPERCPEANDPERGTQELRDAMHEVSRNVPVVFGRLGYNEERIEREWPDKLPELKRRDFRSTQLILAPTVEFLNREYQEVSSGMVNLNCDVRKIPLKWPAYANMASVGTEAPQVYDSLALTALRAYSPDEKIVNRVEHLQSEGKHPFTSFLSEEEFRGRTVSALEVAGL